MSSIIEGTNPIVTQTKFGKFVLEPSDGVCQTIREDKFWDDWLLPFFDNLTKEEVAVEIGGHIGFHTVYMARKCKNIHIFEPQLINYNRIIKNCELNDVNNVSYYNFALYSKSCEMSIHNQPDLQKNINYNTCQACSLSLRENDKGDIEARTLDSFNIQNVSFIKIDAENQDLDVIKGAKETIKRDRPKIIFESSNESSQIRDCNALMDEIGYKIESVASCNWLAIPKD